MAQALRLSTTDPSFEADFKARLHWSEQTDAAIEQRVADILADVRARGDQAVLEYTRRFDGLDAASMGELELSAASLRAAFEGLPLAQRTALETAAARVRAMRAVLQRPCCHVTSRTAAASHSLPLRLRLRPRLRRQHRRPRWRPRRRPLRRPSRRLLRTLHRPRPTPRRHRKAVRHRGARFAPVAPESFARRAVSPRRRQPHHPNVRRRVKFVRNRPRHARPLRLRRARRHRCAARVARSSRRPLAWVAVASRRRLPAAWVGPRVDPAVRLVLAAQVLVPADSPVAVLAPEVSPVAVEVGVLVVVLVAAASAAARVAPVEVQAAVAVVAPGAASGVPHGARSGVATSTRANCSRVSRSRLRTLPFPKARSSFRAASRSRNTHRS